MDVDVAVGTDFAVKYFLTYIFTSLVVVLLSQGGETVTGGLKRLGLLAAKPRRGKQSKAPAAHATRAVLTEEERQRAREAFDELTEASSALMDSGELDVYSKNKVPLRVSTSAICVPCCPLYA